MASSDNTCGGTIYTSLIHHFTHCLSNNFHSIDDNGKMDDPLLKGSDSSSMMPNKDSEWKQVHGDVFYPPYASLTCHSCYFGYRVAIDHTYNGSYFICCFRTIAW